MGGKRDQIDIDRQQDQLDRHQDDDDILAIDEDAKNAEREQDGGDRKVMAEPDDHDQIPWPGRTFLSSIAVRGERATCSAIFWRLTLGLWRNVSTIAPIIATSSTMPAISKK